MRERLFTYLEPAHVFLIAAWLFFTACGSPPKTDLRKLVPSDTLIYLETNDVAATLEALTASPAFQSLAPNKPDFSALQNVQMAVAVTGFETSEANAVLNLKPHFVAVIETHAWHWQAVALAENGLDTLVRKSYGETAKREASEKDGGKLFVWTAADERSVSAFVSDGLIYFGSDADAIEKCLAVKKGAAESLAQNEPFSRAYSENNLAFGYVSTAGIKRIADLAGVSAAVGASEEPDERSFIARVLPQILQSATKEIVWTANRVEGGIEDKYTVGLTNETAAALNALPNSDARSETGEFLPSDVYSATRYHLPNPLIAWRGSILLTTRNVDALSGKILNEFSGKLLEPYGISDAENFLSAVDSPLTTAQFDAEGERSVSMATVVDSAKLKAAVSKEIDFKKPPEKLANAEIWFSGDKLLAAAFIENKLILGDGASVLKCLQAKTSGKNPAFRRFGSSRAVAATFGTDADSAVKIVGVLAQATGENRKPATFYTTETRLTENGFERVSIADFGLIGTILKNLN